MCDNRPSAAVAAWALGDAQSSGALAQLLDDLGRKRDADLLDAVNIEDIPSVCRLAFRLGRVS